MSDLRKERVSPHTLNELISLLQSAHAALAGAAHSLMMYTGVRTFELAAGHGEEMRFTRLFPDMPGCPSDNSAPPGE